MAIIRKKTDNPEPIPMAPMIDMVFLLLVFFMTVSSVAKSSKVISLDLPESNTAPVAKDFNGRGIISIDNTGNFYVGSKIMEINDISKVLKSWIESDEKLKLQIRADKDTGYIHVKKILKACAEVGVYDIIFSTYQDDR